MVRFPRQRPERKSFTLVILSLLASLSCPLSNAHASQTVGRVVFTQGVLKVSPQAEGPWAPAQVGMELQAGDHLETDEGARAAILLWDESLIQLRGQSRLVLKDVIPSGGFLGRIVKASSLRRAMSLYRLLVGEVWIRASREMQWEVSGALVGVRGTEVGIRLSATGEARVWVLSGGVTIRHPLGDLELGEMEEAVMGPIQAPAKRTILVRPLETVQWVLRYPVWMSPRDFGVSSLSEVSAEDPLAWAGLAMRPLQMGRWEEAERVLNQAPAEAGNSPAILALKGMARLGQGRPEEARPLLEKAVAGRDPPVLAYTQLGLISLAWNDLAEAQSWANRAISAFPESPTAHLVQAWLHRARGDLESALAEARSCLRLDPRHLPALVQAAELCFGMDRKAEALRYLGEAREIAPESPQVHLLEGFVHLAEGDGLAAEAAFMSALAQDASLGEAHMGLGILHMRRDKTESALEAFLSGVLLEPYVSLPQSYLAKALHEMGRHEEALKVLERASDLDPRDPTPLLYRALILRDLHRPGEAVDSLEASLARNQGRCVYRSRFLLDQDRAVRNVNLAEAFKEMGLLAWARNRAILSVRDDPSNSSAHLFLASAFREEGRTRAGVRELLRARLLMPVNVNSFNTFHDYTMLFEGTRLQGELEGGVGEHNSRFGDVLLQGGSGPLAGLIAVRGDETKGCHGENNGERNLNGFLDLKAELAAGHELLVHGETLRWAAGDHLGDADAAWVQDPFFHQKGFVDEWALGYRWRRGPMEDVLLYLLWHGARTDLEDRTIAPLGAGLSLGQDLDWRLQGRALQASLVHMGRVGEHRWEWGGHGVWGKESLDRDDLLTLSAGGIPVGTLSRREETTIPPAFVDLHLGDVWRPLPGLFAEGSLHVQWSRMGTSPPVHSSETQSRLRWGPRLGVIWSPNSRDTLRMALAQYAEPSYTVLEGLQPVEVAGFPLGEDAAPGSWNQEARAAWERKWGSSFFTHLSGGFRIHRVWEEGPVTHQFQARDLREWRGEAETDLLILPTVSLVGRYALRHFRWEEIHDLPGIWPEESWLEHRGVVEMRWIHPNGWRIAIRETGVLQRGDLGAGRHKEDAFWTDVLVEKYLGGRQWLLRLAAENAFDQRFRLKTHELVREAGRPARQVTLSVRFQF